LIIHNEVSMFCTCVNR